MKKIIIFILFLYPLLLMCETNVYKSYTHSKYTISLGYGKQYVGLFKYINYEIPEIPENSREIFDNIALNYGKDNSIYTFNFSVNIIMFENYKDLHNGKNFDIIVKNNYDNRITPAEEEAYSILRQIIKSKFASSKIDVKSIYKSFNLNDIIYTAPVIATIEYKYVYDISESHLRYDDNCPHIYSISENYYEAGPPPKKKNKNKSERNSK